MNFQTVAAAAALLGVAACMGSSPGPVSMNAGVGFGDYQNYLRERESAAMRGVPYSVPPEQTRARQTPIAPTAALPPAAVPPSPASPVAFASLPAAQPLPQPVTMTPLAAPQQAPVMQTAAAPVGAPLSAPMRTDLPAQPAIAPRALPPVASPQAQPVTAAAGFGTTPAFDPGGAVRPSISNEQDFAAVSARETIESDRERLARQREQYQQIQVASVPDNSVSGGPNLMDFALATRHPVGTQVYTRLNPLRWSRWENACLQFRNQEAAQSAFLAAGGPERDPGNLDPDGDGYACWWDPAPYRAAVQAAIR